MNGEGASVNGQRLPNGTPSIKPIQPPEGKPVRSTDSAISRPPDFPPSKSQPNGVPGGQHVNGAFVAPRDLDNAPEEPLQLVEVSHYLPIATLISRSAQICWDELYEMIEQLATIEIPQQAVDGPRLPGYTPGVNNVTRQNLDKKERILNLANDHKANFIKLLVLLQWSQNVDDVSKTISLNFWLHQQREQYDQACWNLYMLKTEATEWQLPNPDIDTAGQVLALGKVPALPHLGYRPLGKLSRKQILATLRRLDNILTTRLALEEDVPALFRNYHVHDGRVTFKVENEFEVDLSILGATSESKYQMVDIRFLFTPRPSIPEQLRMQLESLTNDELFKNGLLGCYKFLHELSLSNKLTEYHKQALELSKHQYAGQLKVELLHRILIVRYWTERPIAKSWFEIGVYSQKASLDQAHPTSTLGVRWFREAKQADDFQIDLDPHTVSLTSILSQIVAQHTTHILDLVYDRLEASPLFSSAALALEESTSLFRPEECSLGIQTTRNSQIAITIDPVTGSMVISPASEKANRLQLEINRSKNVVEDFVPKFLNFRCAVAEAHVLAANRSTAWYALSAFKPSTADLRNVFGPSAARVSFFRHPLWSDSYLLAVIYKPAGDALSIIEMPSNSASLTTVRTVHTQSIRPSDNVSVTFFEAYAEYASGIVTLDSLSQQFRQAAFRHEMLALPDFGYKARLPALTFETTRKSGSGADMPSDNVAKIRFVRTNSSKRTGTILVRLRTRAPKDVLRQLSKSCSNTAMKFTFKRGQITLFLNYEFSNLSAVDIAQQVTQLTDVIACVQVVEKVPWLQLVSVSLRAVALSYQLGNSTKREFRTHFRHGSEPAHVEFLPRDSNPHAILEKAMSEALQDTQTAFGNRFEQSCVALSLVSPTLECIHDLQYAKGNAQPPGRASVKIHLIARQTTSFCLYFSATDSKRTEHNPTAAPSDPRLLARFDILPFLHEKACFALRPAQEELRGQKRLSFASDAMRERVRNDFFRVNIDDPDQDIWRMDQGAVFLADRPRPLLEGLFKVMIEFAQDPTLGIKAVPNGDARTAHEPAATANTKTNSSGPQKAVPKTPQQGQRNMPNGTNIQRPKPANKPQPKAPTEVITLD